MLRTDLEEKSSDDGLVTQIINDMVYLCMVKGIVVKSLPKSKDDDQPQFEHMAISLFSTPFPFDKYEHAKKI
jgi:hypothetical protein